MNLLNHREAVCFFKTSSCGTIERIQLIQRIFFDHEPLARRSQLHELHEFFAFLAKAPSGWFPKSLV